MPNINPVDPTRAAPRVAAQLAQVERKLGMLPNLIATIAHSPAALTAYLGSAEALAGGTLSERERERIALAVAQYNACGYCLAAHSALAARSGLDAIEIGEARAGRGRSPRDAALLSFVIVVLERQGAVAGEEIAVLRQAGFGDAETVEIVAHIALNVFTNYLNNAARTDVDFPPVDAGRAA